MHDGKHDSILRDVICISTMLSMQRTSSNALLQYSKLSCLGSCDASQLHYKLWKGIDRLASNALDPVCCSADMLQDIRVPWVILGHSERRSLLKESEDVRNLQYMPLHSMHTKANAASQRCEHTSVACHQLNCKG